MHWRSTSPELEHSCKLRVLRNIAVIGEHCRGTGRSLNARRHAGGPCGVIRRDRLAFVVRFRSPQFKPTLSGYWTPNTVLSPLDRVCAGQCDQHAESLVPPGRRYLVLFYFVAYQ